MPHIAHTRYADGVARSSRCHVERPLDDAVWARFRALLRRRPAGSGSPRSSARPTPSRRGRGSAGSSGRARRSTLAVRAPHALDVADARAADRAAIPAARVRRELDWLRAQGLDAALLLRRRLVHGRDVRRRSPRPGSPTAPRRRSRCRTAAAAWSTAPQPGLLPATHTLGMLARAVAPAGLRPCVLPRHGPARPPARARARARAACCSRVGGPPGDLDELSRRERAVNTMSFANSRAWSGTSRPAMKRSSTSCHPASSRANVARREQVEVGRVLLGRPAAQEGEPVLQPDTRSAPIRRAVRRAVSTRAASATTAAGSRRCSSSSPATTTSKLPSGRSSGCSTSAQRSRCRASRPRRAPPGRRRPRRRRCPRRRPGSARRSGSRGRGRAAPGRRPGARTARPARHRRTRSPEAVARDGAPGTARSSCSRRLKALILRRPLDLALVTTAADPEAPPEEGRLRVSSDIRATRTSFLARPPLRTLLRRLVLDRSSPDDRRLRPRAGPLPRARVPRGSTTSTSCRSGASRGRPRSSGSRSSR